MKSILMSIKPKYVAKILNGEKTIEVRKRFPKGYRGWVYIYCTKSQINQAREYFAFEELHRLGKVVARFYCDNVEEIKFDDKEVQRQACLTEYELFDYLFINEPYHEDMHKGYSIHISQLEIFDKPKELSEFYTKYYPQFVNMVKNKTHYELIPLTKAPQSWQYIEVAK